MSALMLDISGVPQGSILRPIFFFNDLPPTFSVAKIVKRFADNSKCFGKINVPRDVID